MAGHFLFSLSLIGYLTIVLVFGAEDGITDLVVKDVRITATPIWANDTGILSCSDDSSIIGSNLENITIVLAVTDAECNFTYSNVEKDSFLRLSFEPKMFGVNSSATILYSSSFRKPFQLMKYRISAGTDEKKAVIELAGNEFGVQWRNEESTSDGSDMQLGVRFEKIPKTIISETFTEDLKSKVRLQNIKDYHGYKKNSETNVFLLGKITQDTESASVVIVVNKLVLDSQAGDFLVIGSGNASTFFLGPKSDILRKPIDKPTIFTVSGRDAFLTFTSMMSNRNDADFEIDFERKGVGLITEPVVIATVAPQTSAEREALPLCFNKIKKGPITCKNFTSLKSDMLRDFKIAITEVAQQFVDENGIQLPTSGGIRADQIVIDCYYRNATKGKPHEENYLTLVIVSPLDKDKHILDKHQTSEMMKNFRYDIYKKLNDAFEVRQCETYPNYWLWFWGSVGFFIICVLVLAAAWYLNNRDLFEDKKRFSKIEPPSFMDHKSTDNPTYQDDDGMYLKSHPYNDQQFQDEEELDTEQQSYFIGQDINNITLEIIQPNLASNDTKKPGSILKRHKSHNIAHYKNVAEKKPWVKNFIRDRPLSDPSIMLNRPAMEVPNTAESPATGAVTAVTLDKINFTRVPSDDESSLHIPPILRSAAASSESSPPAATNIVHLADESDTDPHHIYEDPRDVNSQLMLEGCAQDETRL